MDVYVAVSKNVKDCTYDLRKNFREEPLVLF
jgi:hypothetical protein